MVSVFARDTPAAGRTLLALRRKGCYERVVTGNWSHLCSTSWGSHLGEEVNIDLVIVRPLPREVILVVDCLDRAHGFTCSTIHTLVWVDIEHAIAFVDAVDGAFIYAGLVLDVNTW
jgi:hypothetical protein